MKEETITVWGVRECGTACPVCGKKSYSSNGIHPQCAMLQADSARTEKLKAERKLKAGKIEAAPKPTTWTKKKCRVCGKESHVRTKTCGCGHAF